ncbi:MAG: guanylate kinase [Bacteroidales bacterium]|nr:guanylate kinase [Bacteroidales bacterium]
MSGKMIIISAPSGAGKTTIVKHLLSCDFNLEFSISACSRAIREIETHSKDYYFYSVEEFKDKIKAQEFIEWEEVYKDCFYGTLKSEVNRIWNKGGNVIFDVDVKGGINIKKQYGDKALSIFIKPPSVEELEKRLLNRSTDNSQDISTRVEKAKHELTFANQFDKIIVNDNLEKAIQETTGIVEMFLNL